MATARTALRIPAPLIAAIDKKAGPGKRSAFIIDACYEKLGIQVPGATKPKVTRDEVTPRPKSVK